MTHKITRAVAMIAAGAQDCLSLGNLDAVRDWSHAKEGVRGMWRLLQQETSSDDVPTIGRAATVRDFCQDAFAPPIWTGSMTPTVGPHARR